MRLTANLATFHKREHTLYEVLGYLTEQTTPFDLIRVYANDFEPNINHPKVEVTTGEDLTDRGKFYFHEPNDEIYFTVDDDLIYPPDYVETTLQYLEKYGGIVTYHGRKLKGLGRHFYKGHDTHHFKFQTGATTQVDVPGTGVMAFHSKDITPKVLDYQHDKMVDVLIGLEAAKQDVPITCVKHKTAWIENIVTQTAIYSEMRNDCEVQSRLADEIYQIRN